MDDVVQEVFIVIHSKLHTLEPQQALRSWIYGIVRGKVSEYQASGGTKQSSGVILAEHVRSGSAVPPTPEALTERASKVELLSSLLAELEESEREVFELVELEQMSVPEVADALEIPVDTAYSRLRTARQLFEEARLRHALSEAGKERPCPS
jgi:RNA polymerase sigma-70 factor (ECF subfamily)